LQKRISTIEQEGELSMCRTTHAVLIAAFLLSGIAQAQVPEGFIKTWLLCGPFPNPRAAQPQPGKVTRCPGLDADYLKEHGGESKSAPRVGMAHAKEDGTTVAWFEYTSDEDRVPFRKAITRQSDVVGYAYGIVTAEKAGRYVMALGSDEGVCLWVNGKTLTDLTMPDFAKLRVEEFRWWAPRGFPGYVFAGEEFPRIDFEKPLSAEGLIGRYAITTTFYDADYNAVTKAEKPGRYGAVVDIETDARQTRRFVTLFRQKEEMSWWRHELEAELSLPEELGVSADVAEAYSEHVNGFLKDQLATGLGRDQSGAVLLAGLLEAEADGVASGYYASPNMRDRSWWLPLKRKLYGSDKTYPEPFVCPGKLDGPATNTVRKGSLREAGMKKDFAKKMDKHLKAWESDTDEAFALIVVRHGVIAFHKAYGIRDEKPMTVETKSWMASTTKMISATLIMMLVDQGLLDLDDRADAFLPPLRGASKEWPATIRNLYMHTASLRGHWGSWMHDMEYRIAEKIPFFVVGERCAYDGAGLEVACKVLEVISGETLPEFYQNHLLKPLGMKDTEISNACSDAKSAPLDMAKLGQMLLQKGAYGDMRFFSEETFEQMLPQKPKGDETIIGGQYGIGTTYFTYEGMPEGTFAHGSASKSITRIDPTHDLVIVMTRNAAGDSYGKHHQGFIDIILESLE
jgi:CubicO group peptidase (beta-lactamase class C family)